MTALELIAQAEKVLALAPHEVDQQATLMLSFLEGVDQFLATLKPPVERTPELVKLGEMHGLVLARLQNDSKELAARIDRIGKGKQGLLKYLDSLPQRISAWPTRKS